MNTISNIRHIAKLSGELLDDFLLLFDGCMQREGDLAYIPYGRLGPLDESVVPGSRATSRLSCDVALGYLAAYIQRPDAARLDTALSLLRYAFTRQNPEGYFVWNYGRREIDNVDLGTVLDTYWWFWTLLGEDLPGDVRDGILDSTRRAVEYLSTMHQPGREGVIQKRAPAPEHPDDKPTADYTKIDVLNGNALAMTAYCREADILGRSELVDRAALLEANLLEAFGRHTPGWWAYIENIETRECLCAETILYQAMTALYLEPYYRVRPSDAMAETLAASLEALATVVDEDGRLDWSRESRGMFNASPMFMLPSAAVALADVCDITDAARRRLEFVATHCYDRNEHRFLYEDSRPAGELLQIWAASDLGLILLNNRRQIDALSA